MRSTRVGGKVRQITLLNLGRHFAVPPAEWPPLCVRLEELLAGQGVLLEGALSPPVEREAQRLGAQLLARQPVTTPAPSPTSEASPTPDAAPPPAAPPELDTIEVDSLIFSRLCRALAQIQLGDDEALLVTEWPRCELDLAGGGLYRFL